MAGIDAQARRRHRGHAGGLPDPLDHAPAIPIPPMALQSRLPLQPERVRAVEGQRVHAFAAHRRDRLEARRAGPQHRDARIARHPRHAVGCDHQRLDIRGPEAAGLARGDVAQHPAGRRVSLLDAATGRRQPQAAVRGHRQLVDLPGRRGIDRIAGTPFVDGALRGDPQQPVAMPEPQPARRILEQGHRLGGRQARQAVGFERFDASVRVQALDHAVVAGQPESAIPRRRDGPVHGAAQAVALACVGRQVAPVGTQVAQAEARQGCPQGTVGLRHEGHHQTRDVRAARFHRHRDRLAVLPPQPALAADPVVAGGIGGDRGQRIRALEHRGPRRLDPASRPLLPDPERGTRPQAIRLRHQRIHDRRCISPRQRFDHPARAGPAREAGIGPRPRRARGIHRQRQHRVRGQAFRLGLASHAPVAVDAGDAGIVGADPDRLALHRQRPHLVAAQAIVLAQPGETPPLRVEDGDAGSFHRDPDAVARVHREGLDVVAGQAAGIAGDMPPDAHAHPIVAGQAIGRGDPQVAGAIARQRLDLGRGQALRRTGDAETRPFGHAGERAGAGQPQPHRDPSPMPHVPSPRAC